MSLEVDGHAVRAVLGRDADVLAYIVGFYFVFVFKGPAILAKLKWGTGGSNDGKHVTTSTTLRNFMAAWNFGLSLFSFCGASVIFPALINSLATRGFHATTCEFRDDLFYTGRVGYWMTLFNLSKLAELVDTLFLELDQKPLPFLHWYHHATVLMFCWYTHATGSSSLIYFAAFNLTVHSIMYFYFGVCALGYKTQFRPIAPYITILQMIQMVGCISTAVYSGYQYYLGENGCDVTPSNIRFGTIIYTSYLVMFARLYLNSYVWPKQRTPAVKSA